MKDILNPWVILGSILTATTLLLISLYAAGSLVPGSQESYTGQAGLTVIPVPTYTITPRPTAPQPTPTEEVPSRLSVGSYVEISGTEGEGLRLRSSPSLSGEIVYLGLEGEVFFVEGGPQQGDGYQWLKLVAPLNEQRTGWAVTNFLVPAQSP